MFNQKMTTSLIAIAVMLGSGIFLTAQDSDPFSRTGTNQTQLRETLRFNRTQTNNQRAFLDSQWRLASPGGEVANDVSVAVTALKSADSDEEKSEAKSKLREALVADYEDKMDRYDEHLEKLEKELDAMRERLSRRRKAQEEMVDLKLSEIIANADGLGWPTGPVGGSTTIFGNEPRYFPGSTGNQYRAFAQPQFPSQQPARPILNKRVPATLPKTNQDGR